MKLCQPLCAVYKNHGIHKNKELVQKQLMFTKFNLFSLNLEQQYTSLGIWLTKWQWFPHSCMLTSPVNKLGTIAFQKIETYPLFPIVFCSSTPNHPGGEEPDRGRGTYSQFCVQSLRKSPAHVLLGERRKETEHEEEPVQSLWHALRQCSENRNSQAQRQWFFYLCRRKRSRRSCQEHWSPEGLQDRPRRKR